VRTNWIFPCASGRLGGEPTPLPAADAVRALGPGEGLVVEGPTGPESALFITAALDPAGRFVVQARLRECLLSIFLEDPDQPDGEAPVVLPGGPAFPFPPRLLCDRSAVTLAAETLAARGELDERLSWRKYGKQTPA
jgi:hypothetical protein